MIFSIKIIRCIYNILAILGRNRENYTYLYKEIGLSHETLQTALKYLLENNFILREDKGHKKSYYLISIKGKEALYKLEELKEIFK